MKSGRSAHGRVIHLFLFLTLSAVLLLSCTRQDSSVHFSQALQHIDQLISAGDSVHALKHLKSLRSSAKTVSQSLSLVKRQRALGAHALAVQTLQKALLDLPSNLNLTALLVDTLITLDRNEEACVYSSVLANSSFSPLAALAEIKRDAHKNTVAIDPVYWNYAYSATGNSLFLRNALVLFAHQGSLTTALSLVASDSKSMATSAFLSNDRNRYLVALLSYDAGVYDQVYHYLEVGIEKSRSFEELCLISDAASTRSDFTLARACWQGLVSNYPDRSPDAFYNLAVTADKFPEFKNSLEAGLSLFPSYYPAVARYVRSVPSDIQKEKSDPVIDELKRAGFRSLSMEEAFLNTPILFDKASFVLDAALSTSSKDIDSRLFLENFRFKQSLKKDSIRSASEMWKLLERFPNDSFIHAYAVWYFASIQNFDACFGLNGNSRFSEDFFYTGLEKAFSGDLAAAEDAFAKVANDETKAWCALANIARIHLKKNEYEKAAEEFSIASGFAPDLQKKSHLQYENAKILLDLRYPERAENILRYALELDSSNYQASLLLRQIEAQK